MDWDYWMLLALWRHVAAAYSEFLQRKLLSPNAGCPRCCCCRLHAIDAAFPYGLRKTSRVMWNHGKMVCLKLPASAVPYLCRHVSVPSTVIQISVQSLNLKVLSLGLVPIRPTSWTTSRPVGKKGCLFWVPCTGSAHCLSTVCVLDYLLLFSDIIWKNVVVTGLNTLICLSGIP